MGRTNTTANTHIQRTNTVADDIADLTDRMESFESPGLTSNFIDAAEEN